jgi:hypothetical protein
MGDHSSKKVKSKKHSKSKNNHAKGEKEKLNKEAPETIIEMPSAEAPALNEFQNETPIMMQEDVHSEEMHETKKKSKSQYRMKGMGALLSMYGGAGEEIESDYEHKREQFLQAKEAYASENDKSKREELRQTMIKSKEKMDMAKEKMKMLLRGVSEASAKAASHLM